MKHLLVLFLFTLSLSSKSLTPSDVFGIATNIQEEIHALLKHYDIKHKHDEIMKNDKVLNTKLKPRNIWQKTYEILVKINMLRVKHGLPRIEPVGIEARLDLNPDMVYEMNIRILAEIEIFKLRNSIKVKEYKEKKYYNKIPLDNYHIYVDISAALDELNEQALTPSYVFAETMRIYDDITIILNYLDIKDETMPSEMIKNAKPQDAFNTSFKLLLKLAEFQRNVGIQAIDFSEFKKEKARPSEVYTITGLIIAELQTLKAYIGLTRSVTPSASAYRGKIPGNVEQLMRWNLKRLNQIDKLYKGGR